MRRRNKVRPRVINACNADYYAHSAEKIIEFVFPETETHAAIVGLLSFRRDAQGLPVIEAYRCDGPVTIKGGR